jgi:putative flippase GtrA
VHLGLFAALVPAVGSTQAANLVALLVATVANTALNRRWTFGVQGAGAVRHQLQGLSIFALTWLVTAGALAVLHAVVATPSTTMATLVVASATAASTGLRFVAMRSWIFRRDPRYPVTPNELVATGQGSITTICERTYSRT